MPTQAWACHPASQGKMVNSDDSDGGRHSFRGVLIAGYLRRPLGLGCRRSRRRRRLLEFEPLESRVLLSGSPAHAQELPEAGGAATFRLPAPSFTEQPAVPFTGDLTRAEPMIVVGDPEGSPPVVPDDRVNPNLPTSPFAGVVSINPFNTRQGSFLCTAALISPFHLLTAAHCLDVAGAPRLGGGTTGDGTADFAPGEVAVVFNHDNPTNDASGATIGFGVLDITLHPDWHGFLNRNAPEGASINDDVAVLTLAQAAPAGIPIYPLVSDPFDLAEQIVLAGYGTTGNAIDGFIDGTADFFVKRTGQNVAGAFDLDDEGAETKELFLFDFDGPDAITDTLSDGPTLGNDVEVTLGGGDSGGTSFVWMDVNGNGTLDPGELSLFGVNTFGLGGGGIPSPPQFGSQGGGMIVSTYREWINSVLGPNPTEPPTVTEVLLSASTWSRAFLDHLESSGLGSDGYRIPTGSSAQFAPLPWFNVDQIVIRFGEDVVVQQDDLAVRGVNVASYGFSGFSYDPGTFTATWTLSSPLSTDKLLLDLDGSSATGVVDVDEGFLLDGEFTNGVDVLPASGDGTPGGDFTLRVNVLPGDVNQSGTVNLGDVLPVFFAVPSSIGDAGYSVLFDVNGSGTINLGDVLPIFFSVPDSLPDGEPAGASTVGVFEAPRLSRPGSVNYAQATDGMGSFFVDSDSRQERAIPYRLDSNRPSASASARQSAQGDVPAAYASAGGRGSLSAPGPRHPDKGGQAAHATHRRLVVELAFADLGPDWLNDDLPTELTPVAEVARLRGRA